jgi:hypothetical protein
VDLIHIAGALTHEHQCWGSDESAVVLSNLASRIAGMIEDPRERKSFVDAATMSGLSVVAP